MYERDPLSVLFDQPAREFLQRAYAARGEWVGQYLPPPGVRGRAWAAFYGIDPWAVDRWGEVRWVRAFERAVFWQAKYYGGTRGLRQTPNVASGGGDSHWGAPIRVEWETGARVLRPGWPQRRWAVRIRIHPRSAKTERLGLAARHPWIHNGRPTDWASTPADRDW